MCSRLIRRTLTNCRPPFSVTVIRPLLSVAHDATVLAAGVTGGSLLVLRDGDVSLRWHPDPRSVAAALYRCRIHCRIVGGIVQIGQQTRPSQRRRVDGGR